MCALLGGASSVSGLSGKLNHIDLSEPLDPQVFASPSTVTSMDLSTSTFHISFTWRTGKLHPSLLKFTNLQVLHAEQLGIIVLDEWISRLKNLREIYLANNEITTWPQHFIKMPSLKIISMEGNPCLETQFQKSVTFRHNFFNWRPFQLGLINAHPEVISAPEWPAASQQRLHTNLIGTYCGGIYSLAEHQGPSDDDFLTTMGPSRLDMRASVPPPLLKSPLRNSASPTSTESSLPFEYYQRTSLIMELLSGAATLSGLRQHKVSHFHSEPTNRYNMGGKVDQLHAAFTKFISEEHPFALRLQETLVVFLSRNVPSAFSKELNGIFAAMPALYILHYRHLFSILNRAYKRMINGKDLQLARFAKSISSLLDKGQFDCYHDFSANYTRAQWKLWCCINPDSHFEDETLNINARLGEWLYKEAMDNPLHTLEHAASYVDYPLDRLQRYCEFFGELAEFFPACKPVASRLETINAQVRATIAQDRRQLRIVRLGEHYSLTTKGKMLLSQYKWDALLNVSSRVFLEKGLNKCKTKDVLVHRSDRPPLMSVVSEFFGDGERIIRLIYCLGNIQIWDESVQKYVGDVDPHEVYLEKMGDERGMRVTFSELDETIRCNLLAFTSVDIVDVEGERAFCEALDRLREGESGLHSFVSQSSLHHI